MVDRVVYKTTKSPPEQNYVCGIKLKDLKEETIHLKGDENSLIVSDDVLDSSNATNIDQFFIRGQYNILSNFYVAESYFDFTERTKPNNSIIINFLNTL